MAIRYRHCGFGVGPRVHPASHRHPMITRIITRGDGGDAEVMIGGAPMAPLTRFLSILTVYMVMMVTVVTVLGECPAWA
jgi:hypothetical protein